MKALLILLLSVTGCYGQSIKFLDLDSAFKDRDGRFLIPSPRYDRVDRSIELMIEWSYGYYPIRNREISITNWNMGTVAFKENGKGTVINAPEALEIMWKENQRSIERYNELQKKYDAAIELIIQISPKTYRILNNKSTQI